MAMSSWGMYLRRSDDGSWRAVVAGQEGRPSVAAATDEPANKTPGEAPTQWSRLKRWLMLGDDRGRARGRR